MIVWILATLIALIPVSSVSASTAEERVELFRLSSELAYLLTDIEHVSASVATSPAQESIALTRLSSELQFFVMRLIKTSELRRVDDLEAFDYEDRFRSLQTFYQAIERHLKKSKDLPVVFNYEKLMLDISTERMAFDNHLAQHFKQAKTIQKLEPQHDSIH